MSRHVIPEPYEQALADAIGIPMTFHDTEVNGLRMQYAVAGAGDPVVLVHGGLIGWGQWYPNIAALASRFTVYIPDLPGAGRSERVPVQALNFQRHFADALVAFLASEVPTPAHLIGTSNGGWVALRTALASPRVRKLVLADGVGFSAHVTFPDRVLSLAPLAHLLARTVFKPHRANVRLEMLLRSVLHRKDLPLAPAFVEYFYATMAVSHNLPFISRLAREAARGNLDLRGELHGVANPALILWGAQDAIMPLAHHQPGFCHLPQATVQIIDSAGHMPSLETPDDFNRAVLAFLAA